MTEVEISEVVSRVRPIDSHALLAPHTLRRIVEAVLEAMKNQQSHDERVRAERRVTAGVSAEMEEEER